MELHIFVAVTLFMMGICLLLLVINLMVENYPISGRVMNIINRTFEYSFIILFIMVFFFLLDLAIRIATFSL